MRLTLALLLGRIVRVLARLRGGGSAIPGRVAMLLYPKLLAKTLGTLAHGVVLISGSNGKSTTTALVTAALRSQGLKVLSNPSGGNMPQGIASAVIANCSLSGKLSADVAVLEVDEAYGEVLLAHFRPSWVVLTNIQVDQLNRFFEPDRVYQMLRKTALGATGVVINASDANLVSLAKSLPESQRVIRCEVSEQALKSWPEGALAATIYDKTAISRKAESPVEVISEVAGEAEISVNSQILKVSLTGKGLHFAIDTGLALALASALLGSKFRSELAVAEIASQPTVYGRGEIASYNSAELQILMMKNPSSMRATLIAMEKPQAAVWIAMDEGTPDPSWLFDIDLSKLGEVKLVSGSRCWHFATRLCYAGLAPEQVLPDSKQALIAYTDYLKKSGSRGTLITNYEQMMEIRKHMGYLDLEGRR